MTIGASMILRQVWHDTFGTKDVQDTETWSYTWLADQFGHVTLGFIITLAFWLVIRLLSGATSSNSGWRGVSAAIIVAALIAAKEAYDFMCEMGRRQLIFPFNAYEVLGNCLTSCLYVWIGAAAAAVAVRHSGWSLLLAVASIFASFPVASYWLGRKIALQQADVPFMYRLANFPDNFANPDGAEIIGRLFAEADPEHRHVVVTGALNSGKTSLAVGAATEFAFRVRRGRFISLIKPAQTGSGAGTAEEQRRGIHPQTTFQDGRTIWPLESVDLLVVDDVDGGIPHLGLDRHKVEKMLFDRLGAEFFERLKERRTLWVAGTNDHAAAWYALVASLLTDDNTDRIGKVALREDLQNTLRPRRWWFGTSRGGPPRARPP